MTSRAMALTLLLATVGTCAAKVHSSRISGSAQTDAAINSLFSASDVAGARSHARKALAVHPNDLDALLVEMEAAALQGDAASELNAALTVCETNERGRDARFAAASSHVLDVAGNTAQFRPQIGRIEKIVQLRNACEGNLRAALLAAAMDGAPSVSPAKLAHESGLLTDWRVAGPFGRYRNVDFERSWAPEAHGLSSSVVDGRSIETIDFVDGTFRLPEYFDHTGVFYAESTIRIERAANRILRVESPGTMEIWIDGVAQLAKDDRFHTTPEVEAVALRLSPGEHLVLVKFVATALPFRVAIFPEPTRPPQRTSRPQSAILDAFIQAEDDYWSGTYDQAIQGFWKLKAKHESAVVDFWLARAWHQDGSDPDQERSLAESAVTLAPSAGAVQYSAAKIAYLSAQVGVAIDRLRRGRELQPDYVPAQELASEIAIKNSWALEERNALENLLRLHPSCANLRHAYEFHISQYDFQSARKLEFQMGTCAPGSLDLAQVLSASGRHREAAAAAQGVVADYPLDRRARSLQVRELGLSQQLGAAHEAAMQLARIAPNWGRAKQLANAAPQELEFDVYGDVTAHSDAQFYQRFRRDGIQLVRQSRSSTYEGSAIRLLEQRILRENSTGDFSLYVHSIVRVSNREEVQQYGEVLVPPDATVIELRTIAPDGTVAEPEFSQDKKTVSMPMLVPGSAIDFEYILHLDTGSIRRDPSDFTFSLGSFQVPVKNSEFDFIAPEHNATTRATARFGAPQPEISTRDGERIERWEAKEMERFRAEPDMPPTTGLPEIKIVPSPQAGWLGIQEALRNSLIDAVRIGPHVEKVASTFGNQTESELAHEIYSYVRDNIHSDGSTFMGDEVTSADDTLAADSGSPTATLIALALAKGLHADLVLAHGIDNSHTGVPSFDTYSRPLVQLTLNGQAGPRRVLLDVEDDDRPFGMLPVDIDTSSALLIPTQSIGPANKPIIALNSRRPDPIVTDGDVFLLHDGSQKVDVRIRFGDERSAILRAGFGEYEKTPKILQQVAQQVFKKAVDVTGEIENEHDADQPLIVHLNFRVPQSEGDQALTVSALLPAFEGKNRFSRSETRHFPLYFDSPQDEITIIRVHLEAGASELDVPSSVSLQTAFGKFRLEVKQNVNSWQIRREVEIPLQVVEPADYQAFAAFISGAQEAQRIALPAPTQGLSAQNSN